MRNNQTHFKKAVQKAFELAKEKGLDVIGVEWMASEEHRLVYRATFSDTHQEDIKEYK